MFNITNYSSLISIAAHSSTNGVLCCFQFFSMIKNVSVNILSNKCFHLFLIIFRGDLVDQMTAWVFFFFFSKQLFFWRMLVLRQQITAELTTFEIMAACLGLLNFLFLCFGLFIHQLDVEIIDKLIFKSNWDMF